MVKRIAVLLFGTLGGLLLAHAAETEAPPSIKFAQPLVQAMTAAAAKDQPDAGDFALIAETTLEFGRRLREGGEKITPDVVTTALHATTEGERLEPGRKDWKTLRSELAKLLEQPPASQQQKPPPNQGDKKDQNTSDSSDEKSSQASEQNKDPESASSQNQPDKAAKEPSGSPADNQSKGQEQGQNQKQQDAGKPGESAFGKFDPPSPANESGAKPSPANDTQQVGGQSTREPVSAQALEDPNLAIPLHKLEQIKQQDSPASLFRAMERREGKPATKSGKTW